MSATFRLIAQVHLVISMAVVGGMYSAPAQADTHNWVAGSGAWGDGSNWSPVGPPSFGDSAFVSFSDGLARTVDFGATDALGLVTLHFDLTGALTRATTLSMNGGTLESQVERVGNFGRGIVNQSGGEHYVDTQLTLGYDTGSNGTYNLTNNAKLYTARTIVGNLGVGTVSILDTATFRAADLWINSQSSVVVNGGTLQFAAVDQPNRINFLSGTVHFEGTHNLGGSAAFNTLFVQNSLARVGNGKNLYVDYATVQIQKMDVDGGLFQTYQLSVNNYATDALRVINGGTVQSTYGYVGYGASGDPYVAGATLVRGLGSNWTTNVLTIGRDTLNSSPQQSTLDIDDGGLVDVNTTVFLERNGIINLSGGTLRLDSLQNFAEPLTSPIKGKFNFNSGTLKFIGNRQVGADQTMIKMVGVAPLISAGKEIVVEGTATLFSAVTVDGGTFTAGQIVNAQRLSLRSGRLNVTNQAVTVGSGGTFESLDVVQGLTFDAAQGITNYGLLTGDGTIGGQLVNAPGGELRAQIGRSLLLTGAGNSNSGQIKLLGGELEFSQDLTNDAGSFISGNGSLHVHGGLSNLGTMNFAGTANVSGPVTNAAGGKIISGGGGATIFYDDVVNNGEIRTSTNGFSVFFGNVSGGGNFTGTGTVNFEGDLSPGSSPATVSFAGNVTLGSDSVLKIELGGTLPGSQYDQLNVAGDLTLAGRLEVTLINGFTPAAGQTFDFLTGGNISGTFSALMLPSLPSLAWDTSQLTSGLLRLSSAGTLGDYDANGTVEAADYVVWRNNLGSSISLPNDDTPGVGQDDYTRWRVHFGQNDSGGSGFGVDAAVPEPLTALLTLPATVFWSWQRREQFSLRRP